jgi:multidrug transporter EmrE-like cation transporter
MAAAPWIVLFILTNAGSALLFKLASGCAVFSVPWWKFFVAGNVTGFFCPVALVFALKGTNANVVYAVCWGGAFCLLQFAAWWFFRQPLSVWQWIGVSLVATGILLLQVRM